jgi:branched-chain amino acid transport system substrate-binding protein
MKKFLLIPLAVILISGLVFSGCAEPAPASNTLKIGGCMPLSGPASAAGIAWKQGWELAFEKINAEGGLKIGSDTYTLELLLEDSKGSAEGGATAATKLCYQNSVKFLMGDISDFMVPPIYAVTSEAGALFCASLVMYSESVPGSYADVGPDKPLLIRMTLTTDETCSMSIQHLVKNYPNAKTIGLMALAFPECDTLNTYYAAAWEPFGLSVSPDYERYPPDLVDFVPTLTRLLATEPDAIVDLSSTLNQFQLIVKTARDLGFNGPIIYPLPCDPLYVAEVMPNISDVITCGFTMDDPNLPDAIKEVIELGRAKYGTDLMEDSIFAYDQVMLLAQMLVKANSVEPKVVQDTFETMTAPGSLQSVFGPANSGGLEKTGVNRALVRPSPLSRLINGKGELVGMFTIEIP